MVTNLLTINGTTEDVAKVLNNIKGSKGEPISFQAFCPMPEDLKGEHKETIKLGGRSISVPDWMLWRFYNWGTKWDAEPIREESVDAPNQIIFNTASTTPDNGIRNLSKMFPGVTFEVIFSDEYAGQYSGRYTFAGGEMTEWICLEDDSDEAMEYYFLTHDYDRENWKKDEDGKWINSYDEEDEYEDE